MTAGNDQVSTVAESNGGRQRSPSTRSAPASGADVSLLEAASTLVGADGGVVLAPGLAPRVLHTIGLSNEQLATFFDLAVSSSAMRRIAGKDLLVLTPFSRGRTHLLLGLLFAGRVALKHAHEQALSLFLELAGREPAQHRRDENRRLEAVSVVQQSISAQSPLSDVFRSIYERAAQEIDAPTFFGASYDAVDQTVNYVFAVQDGVERPPASFAPRPPAGPLLDAIRSGKPQEIGAVEQLSAPSLASVLGDGARPVRSMLIVPMVRGDEVVGVIEAQSYRPSAFSDADISLLWTLAGQAAVALESARLLEETRRQVERLTVLNQVMIMTSRSDNIASACSQALEMVLKAIPGIDLVGVWLVDDVQPGLVRLAATGMAEPDAFRERLPLDDSTLINKTIKSGQPAIIQIKAGAKLPSITKDFVARNQIATLVYIPMRGTRRTIGIFSVASHKHREIDASEVGFLETLAGQLGAQIEAAIMLERHEEERRRLQTVIENLPEAIVIADRDGRIVSHNHVAEELWGHPSQATTLEQIPDANGLLTPEGRPLPWQETPLARSLLRSAPTVGQELRIRRPDGSEVPILSNCAPIYDRQGKLTGSVEVFQDISRLKEIDRLKDNFINTVSHELRTPTTTIRGGALTLLRRGKTLDERTKNQLLRDMAEEAERLHILVEDLLSLARSQAGMQLTTEPVIPHRFVNRMILELGGRVGDHTLTVDVPTDLSIIEADVFSLEQIFRNLLENAVKFSPRGQRIEITAEGDSNEVIFSILDRGSGIPPEDMDRVFEPFYRSEAVIVAAVQGTGLGLAVCKRLVEMHGGRIWAEARPGGGAAFRFTIPSVTEPVDEADG